MALKNGRTTTSLQTVVIGSVIPTGTVQSFAGVTVPEGWLLCDGSAVSRTTYSALFEVISTLHGEGDAVTTFHLPDYRGRFLRGADAAAGRDPNAATRTAANAGGATGDNVGSVQGDDAKSHRHSLRGTASGSGSAGNIGQAGVYGLFGSSQTSGQTYVDIVASSGASWVQNTGGNETRPVNANVSWVIKV
jgi:microcystin-dependent protein